MILNDWINKYKNNKIIYNELDINNILEKFNFNKSDILEQELKNNIDHKRLKLDSIKKGITWKKNFNIKNFYKLKKKNYKNQISELKIDIKENYQENQLKLNKITNNNENKNFKKNINQYNFETPEYKEIKINLNKNFIKNLEIQKLFENKILKVDKLQNIYYTFNNLKIIEKNIFTNKVINEYEYNYKWDDFCYIDGNKCIIKENNDIIIYLKNKFSNKFEFDNNIKDFINLNQSNFLIILNNEIYILEIKDIIIKHIFSCKKVLSFENNIDLYSVFENNKEFILAIIFNNKIYFYDIFNNFKFLKNTDLLIFEDENSIENFQFINNTTFIVYNLKWLKIYKFNKFNINILFQYNNDNIINYGVLNNSYIYLNLNNEYLTFINYKEIDKNTINFKLKISNNLSIIYNTNLILENNFYFIWKFLPLSKLLKKIRNEGNWYSIFYILINPKDQFYLNIINENIDDIYYNMYFFFYKLFFTQKTENKNIINLIFLFFYCIYKTNSENILQNILNKIKDFNNFEYYIHWYLSEEYPFNICKLEDKLCFKIFIQFINEKNEKILNKITCQSLNSILSMKILILVDNLKFYNSAFNLILYIKNKKQFESDIIRILINYILYNININNEKIISILNDLFVNEKSILYKKFDLDLKILLWNNLFLNDTIKEFIFWNLENCLIKFIKINNIKNKIKWDTYYILEYLDLNKMQDNIIFLTSKLNFNKNPILENKIHCLLLKIIRISIIKIKDINSFFCNLLKYNSKLRLNDLIFQKRFINIYENNRLPIEEEEILINLTTNFENSLIRAFFSIKLLKFDDFLNIINKNKPYNKYLITYFQEIPISTFFNFIKNNEIKNNLIKEYFLEKLVDLLKISINHWKNLKLSELEIIDIILKIIKKQTIIDQKIQKYFLELLLKNYPNNILYFLKNYKFKLSLLKEFDNKYIKLFYLNKINKLNYDNIFEIFKEFKSIIEQYYFFKFIKLDNCKIYLNLESEFQLINWYKANKFIKKLEFIEFKDFNFYDNIFIKKNFIISKNIYLSINNILNLYNCNLSRKMVKLITNSFKFEINDVLSKNHVILISNCEKMIILNEKLNFYKFYCIKCFKIHRYKSKKMIKKEVKIDKKVEFSKLDRLFDFDKKFKNFI